MAIEITERRLPITADRVRMFLQEETDSFGVFLDLDRCNEYRYILNEKIIETYQLAKILCGKLVPLKDKYEVIDQFIAFGVPAQTFGNNQLNKEIINNIIANPTSSKNAVVLANVYQTYKTYVVRMSSLNSYVTKLAEDESRFSDKGHRMLVAHPKWKTLNTTRQATSEPNLQAIAKDVADIIVPPAGYHLVRCDSNQIEPRITWSYFMRDELIVNLITMYDDAYFGLLAYCLMSNEEERMYREDFSKYPKMEVTDEMKEKRKQLKVLALAGAYGSTNLDKVDKELASKFEKKITRHPKRLEWQAKVESQVDQGIEVFHGYFGTIVTPDATDKYYRGGSGWRNHVVRCGINNPVQTTASELMNFSVAKAMEILSRARDTHVAFYKHDEACFYVSDYDKENGILDELADVTAYNVEGWIPIPCETVYGTLPGKVATNI